MDTVTARCRPLEQAHVLLAHLDEIRLLCWSTFDESFDLQVPLLVWFEGNAKADILRRAASSLVIVVEVASRPFLYPAGAACKELHSLVDQGLVKEMLNKVQNKRGSRIV